MACLFGGRRYSSVRTQEVTLSVIPGSALTLSNICPPARCRMDRKGPVQRDGADEISRSLERFTTFHSFAVAFGFSSRRVLLVLRHVSARVAGGSVAAPGAAGQDLGEEKREVERVRGQSAVLDAMEKMRKIKAAGASCRRAGNLVFISSCIERVTEEGSGWRSVLFSAQTDSTFSTLLLLLHGPFSFSHFIRVTRAPGNSTAAV